MGRPIGSQNKDKPFRDALRMEAKALEAGEVVDHPRGSLRWNAQQLLLKGDVKAIREVADRLDGKVPQAIVGDDVEDPIRVNDLSDEQRVRALQTLLAKVQARDSMADRGQYR
jgi:hypothetical protein